MVNNRLSVSTCMLRLNKCDFKGEKKEACTKLARDKCVVSRSNKSLSYNFKVRYYKQVTSFSTYCKLHAILLDHNAIVIL